MKRLAVRGFTLIEMVIVVTIITILVAKRAVAPANAQID
jgi:prepilin-type N-terminal cleavage/methylation domain-containing protein